MSEITKLYENAGVKKEVIPCPAKYYGYDCTRNNWDDRDCSCDIEGYPPFTAEKQIELIKWLAYKMHITIGKGLPWGQYDDDWWTVTDKKGYVGTNAYKFEEALANFVNSLWQLLTEEEKQQVKGILK